MNNIEKMKKWAIDNYSNGADTIVECWDNSNYSDLLTDCADNLEKAIDIMRSIAGVYYDRQQDAQYHIDSAY